ncbi:MAG: CDP-diacylglycerol--glycerol-3-phosphate 3-phosphatidyltransferase [Pelagibacteraceae bacterium TMED65]|nr:CDP-diacylglycerol--glycerol-3-phosphate 3-phosphatidyltransferase [Rickettsiales bacterium]OUU51080.1 MAG: CDP-diacylglycerol--glycerol-3-phosphate 3-phosphatidyltransferase [Pelagibacteraceae bacterium TMED65]|tara:strand:- start:1562 stop:2116 length:555 start_codon:yes stop_codon:yes gene_type:complete
MFKLANIPNILTLLRILIIPVIIIFLEIGNEFYNWLSLLLYIIACISDFFDGYLARKFELESSFGRFLDPIADKILIVSVIFILVSNSIITGFFVYPALVIVIREILVSGLRDFFAHSTETLLVTNLSKWKTLIQMFSLGFLIVANNFESNLILYTGFIGLTVASIMTIHTGYIYFKKNLRLFK